MQENPPKKEKSVREERIRKITHLYYSRPDVQKTIYDFSKNREISPRYFEGFGKRPDMFQYKDDVFELVKKGATSFHCSEELWQDPLRIETGMTEKELNDLRIGWDLLIDIDCKWFDYSKLAAKGVIETFRKNGVRNVSIKFSGSKGWHILVPWKAFPKEIVGKKTSDFFPEVPRKLAAFLRVKAEEEMIKLLPKDFYKQFKDVKIKRGIKCKTCNEVADTCTLTELYCDFCNIGETRKVNSRIIQEKLNYPCPECKREMNIKDKKELFECTKCSITSIKIPSNFSLTTQIDLYELMGLDIILVSPRHLFRMPYSLHEKTALASVVIAPEEIDSFELKDANPLTVKIKDFMPNVEEGEAKEFVIQALDWAKENLKEELTKKLGGKYADFKPIKLDNISEENFPPCVIKILEGMNDGKKRALTILINLFRSIGMQKNDMEKRIFGWNQKNEVPLKQGYLISQLSWAYKRKPRMPQNCKEFYQGIGVCLPDNICNAIKNPVNYVVRKNFNANRDKPKVKKPLNKKVVKNKIAKEKKDEKKEKGNKNKVHEIIDDGTEIREV